MDRLGYLLFLILRMASQGQGAGYLPTYLHFFFPLSCGVCLCLPLLPLHVFEAGRVEARPRASYHVSTDNASIRRLRHEFHSGLYIHIYLVPSLYLLPPSSLTFTLTLALSLSLSLLLSHL